MLPVLSDYHANEKERIRYWEKCLVALWKMPEPPEGWAEAARLRDEQGLTKYTVVLQSQQLQLRHDRAADQSHHQNGPSLRWVVFQHTRGRCSCG